MLAAGRARRAQRGPESRIFRLIRPLWLPGGTPKHFTRSDVALTIRNEPQITPDLVASHGLKPDEYERILKLIGAYRPSRNSASSRRCGTSTVPTNPRASICAACRPRRRGSFRGLARMRRHRYRRRPCGGLQDGEPQSPELHRAVSGRDHWCWRHSARRFHHGARARLPVSTL